VVVRRKNKEEKFLHLNKALLSRNLRKLEKLQQVLDFKNLHLDTRLQTRKRAGMIVEITLFLKRE